MNVYLEAKLTKLFNVWYHLLIAIFLIYSVMFSKIRTAVNQKSPANQRSCSQTCKHLNTEV